MMNNLDALLIRLGVMLLVPCLIWGVFMVVLKLIEKWEKRKHD